MKETRQQIFYETSPPKVLKYQQTGKIEDKWASDKKSPTMSETGGEDLSGKVQGAEEGKAGDEKPQICEIGHKDRQALDALLELPRIVVTLKDYTMKLALGAGKVKKTSMKELAKEFKESEEGQLLFDGGSLSFPLFEHVKDKFGLKSVETLERMEKELIHLHGELIKAGLSSEDVTGLAKKDKRTLEKAGQKMAKEY